VTNKTGTTRLGFALMLKFFELEARFPRHADEITSAAVDYVSSQVKPSRTRSRTTGSRGVPSSTTEGRFDTRSASGRSPYQTSGTLDLAGR
jgi:hypothetical protein